MSVAILEEDVECISRSHNTIGIENKYSDRELLSSQKNRGEFVWIDN